MRDEAKTWWLFFGPDVASSYFFLKKILVVLESRTLISVPVLVTFTLNHIDLSGSKINNALGWNMITLILTCYGDTSFFGIGYLEYPKLHSKIFIPLYSESNTKELYKVSLKEVYSPKMSCLSTLYQNIYVKGTNCRQKDMWDPTTFTTTFNLVTRVRLSYFWNNERLKCFNS